jgi:ferric-dicitrate binding protein FerR (iron transport regulator)
VVIPAGIAVAIVAALLMKPSAATMPGVTRSYVTAKGELAVVTLGDGTQAVLSPQTTVRLRNFGRQLRTIEVDGEAYLNVAHVSGAPFVVRSGHVRIQVLGTTFLVRHRSGDARVGVAVLDGRVRMTDARRADSGAMLTAGDVGEATDSVIQVNAVRDVETRAEWTRNQVRFRDTPLSVILATVGRWYGYQFRYADSTLPSRIVTLGVSTQSSAEALAEIERVLKVNVAVVGDTITLIPGPSESRQEKFKMRTYDTWTPNREVGR